MAVYRLFLISTPEALEVELPAGSLEDLLELASRSRFICGRVVDEAGDGLIRAVMLPTNRIQLVIEL